VLPRMRREKNGHVINISSAGVRINTPRFAAYLASKAAFDAFSRVAAGEVHGDGVHFTTVYMPLVRTPMIAPTKNYASTPALTPEQAASWVVRAMVTRPSRLGGPISLSVQAASEIAPRCPRAQHRLPLQPRQHAARAQAPSAAKGPVAR